MAGTTVKWIDGKDQWTPFVRMLGRRLNGMSLAIGVTADKGTALYQNGATVAQVALINELGAPRANIPSRPFIRSTIDNRDNLRKEIREAVRSIAWGAMPQEAMEHVGELAVLAVQETIERMVAPPNAPSTVSSKGENNPLVDMRMLQGSIGYKWSKR